MSSSCNGELLRPAALEILLLSKFSRPGALCCWQLLPLLPLLLPPLLPEPLLQNRCICAASSSRPADRLAVVSSCLVAARSFKSVQYLKGGVDAGFTHVERGVYESRLLHLKGSRSVRVSVVPLSASSLNAGDVFIADLGLKLIQWNGCEANKKEKAKALDVLIGIKDDERGGKATVAIYNQGEEGADFWEALGGKGPVAAAIDDEAKAGEKKGEAKLFKVSDASGTLERTLVGSGSLTREMLDTNDVFLMDNEAEIFVWVGKGCTADEKAGGLQTANDYCTSSGRPKGTKVLKVAEGAEPTTFKQNFMSWKSSLLEGAPQPGSPAGHLSPRTPSNVAKSRESKSSTELASAVKDSAMKRQLERQKTRQAVVSQQGGTAEVWRIEGFDKAPIDPKTFGQFYAGDSYIVKYVYENAKRKPEYILYFWLGSASTADEKGAAALIVTQMDDELGGAATQVRVVMGKEPTHFIRLFKGKMVIHSGGKASGFKNKKDADSYDTDGVSLYHIRGFDEADTRAVQVAETASSLSSGDCFVLLTPGVMFVWMGKESNMSEQETAVDVAEVLQGSRKLTKVEEGEEPDEFWSAIGGKGEYPSGKIALAASREPMMFHVSNATGATVIEPVIDYSQADLEEDDVFILDTYTTVWIWVGDEANKAEIEKATETAQEYCKQQGYSDDTSIVTVKSGAEPTIFTCHFVGWTPKPKSKFVDPYEAKLAAINASNPPDVSDPKPAAPVVPPIAIKKIEPGGEYSFNYEELKVSADKLPSGIDPTKREQYLKDDEFEKVLGSPRGEFAKLKPWKQAQLKKVAGLF